MGFGPLITLLAVGVVALWTGRAVLEAAVAVGVVRLRIGAAPDLLSAVAELRGRLRVGVAVVTRLSGFGASALATGFLAAADLALALVMATASVALAFFFEAVDLVSFKVVAFAFLEEIDLESFKSGEARFVDGAVAFF